MGDKKFAWLTTYGGPSIIIGKNNLKHWSGVGSIEASREFKFDEVEDFMNPELSHYGQACEIENLVGIIKNSEIPEPILVIADEPNPTTILTDTVNTRILIVKWNYGESEEEFESFISFRKLVNLENWQVEFEVELLKKNYVLVDATITGFDTKYEPMLKFEIEPGKYQVSTRMYEPNEDTSMFLHKLSRQ